MHRAFSALFLAVGVLAAPLASRADTLQIFNVANATYLSGATGSGTITIDTTTGTYVGLNFTYQLGATKLIFNTISGQSPFSGQYYFYSFNAAGDLLDLGVPGANLVGYLGGPICTLSGPVACGGSSYVTPMGRALDPESLGSLTLSTPEPSSLALFGTGLTLVVGTLRKRSKLLFVRSRLLH